MALREARDFDVASANLGGKNVAFHQILSVFPMRIGDTHTS